MVSLTIVGVALVLVVGWGGLVWPTIVVVVVVVAVVAVVAVVVVGMIVVVDVVVLPGVVDAARVVVVDVCFGSVADAVPVVAMVVADVVVDEGADPVTFARPDGEGEPLPVASFAAVPGAGDTGGVVSVASSPSGPLRVESDRSFDVPGAPPDAC